VVERRRRPVHAVESAIATAAVLIALLTGSPVPAATLAGVDFPDRISMGGRTLALNGLGLRTTTFLDVRVYVIGLYLERESSDARAVIESSESKRVQMHFVRDVSAEEAREAWKRGFEDNCEDVASLEGEIATFDASMRDMKAGDTLALDFAGDTVDVRINGVVIDTVRGSPFQQALLGIWLGSKPIDSDLKEGILGR
jgi:hypothetical protein